MYIHPDGLTTSSSAFQLSSTGIQVSHITLAVEVEHSIGCVSACVRPCRQTLSNEITFEWVFSQQVKICTPSNMQIVHWVHAHTCLPTIRFSIGSDVSVWLTRQSMPTDRFCRNRITICSQWQPAYRRCRRILYFFSSPTPTWFTGPTRVCPLQTASRLVRPFAGLASVLKRRTRVGHRLDRAASRYL